MAPPTSCTTSRRSPCSIAAAVDGILQAGVVLHVPLNRLSQATRDGGAWENGNRLSVSRNHRSRPFPDRHRGAVQGFLPLRRVPGPAGRITRGATGVRRPGSASLDLTDVAAGRYDGFWEQRLAPWDVAAGTLLVREAGGLVTDYSGRDIGIEHGEIAAGNPAIHRWLLEMLTHNPDGSRTGEVTVGLGRGLPENARLACSQV